MAKEQPPFKVNDIVELQITGLGSSGEGVGKASARHRALRFLLRARCRAKR